MYKKAKNMIFIILFLLAVTATRCYCESTQKYVRTYYVAAESFTREGNRKFTINPELAEYITHAIYAFAVIDQSEFEGIIVSDKEAQTELLKLQQYGIAVSLALGGWADSQEYYRTMLNDENKRNKFVKNVADYLVQNGYDGFDMDLEYPCCWQLNCEENCVVDKENFTKLVIQLRSEFDKRAQSYGKRLLLTVAVYPAKSKIQTMFEVKALSDAVDYLHVITYDLHVGTEGNAMPGAALTQPKAETSSELSVIACMQAWLDAGAPADKLVMGIPFYATSYTLKDESKHCVGDVTEGVGTLETPSFMEVVDVVSKKDWEIMSAPYTTIATKEDQWMSYDDRPDLAKKAQHVIDKNFAGVMIWTADKDYLVEGPCGKYPLMSTLYQVLYNNEDKIASCTQQFSKTTQPTCTEF